MSYGHHRGEGKRVIGRATGRTERGAVTAEKAILTMLVIVFAWAGIHFVGDPMRDEVFRVVFAICERIYESLAAVFVR